MESCKANPQNGPDKVCSFLSHGACSRLERHSLKFTLSAEWVLNALVVLVATGCVCVLVHACICMHPHVSVCLRQTSLGRLHAYACACGKKCFCTCMCVCAHERACTYEFSSDHVSLTRQDQTSRSKALFNSISLRAVERCWLQVLMCVRTPMSVYADAHAHAFFVASQFEPE